MRTISFLIRAAIACGLALATPAARSETRTPACAKRDLVVQRLADRYGETLRSMGLAKNNGLVEVYTSADTGTWTILVTKPDGTSCLLASGQLWENDSAPLTKPGKDA